MDVYIADIFDYFGERPFVVGVFDSEENAWAAIDIVIKQMGKVGDSRHTDPEGRFVPYVTKVQINGFTPACMEWCHSG